MPVSSGVFVNLSQQVVKNGHNGARSVRMCRTSNILPSNYARHDRSFLISVADRWDG